MESYLINKRGDASNWSCSPRFVFLAGVVRTSANLTDVKRPEHALKLFLRFAIAKGVITYGLELMMAVFEIVQGIISKIMTTSGLGSLSKTKLLSEMIKAIEDCGFFESIPLWAVTIIGSLFITILSFVIIMTVYGRFFKLYMYTAIALIASIGSYFLLKPLIGIEAVSWICMLAAVPFGILGFVKYNGMSAEKFIWAWIKSELLMPRKLCFGNDNLYWVLLKEKESPVS